MLVLTSPGERVMEPDFGVGVRSYLFENFNNSVFTEIESAIRKQVSIFLPVMEQVIALACAYLRATHMK